MERISEHTLRSFLDVLASDAPTPGGGAASALFGATGTALALMTANLTDGNPRYAALWYNAEAAIQVGEPLLAAFADLTDADAEAFTGFMRALRMPKETDEQRAARSIALEETTEAAMQPPYQTLLRCRDAVSLLESLCGKVNPTCASDVGVGASAIKAAAESAWLNICINLRSLKNKERATAVYTECKSILESVRARCDNVYAVIETACAPILA